jgi:hypothetical protein
LAAEQGVDELQQRIGAAGAAGVQLGPERDQPREGEDGIGMAAQPDPPDGDRQSHQRKRPTGLNRKLASLLTWWCDQAAGQAVSLMAG